MRLRQFLLLLPLCLAAPVSADPVRVAVAANFAGPLRELVSEYQRQTPDADIEIVVGATGKLAAQIRQGAPFHLFLAADRRRPRELAEQGYGDADSRRTYALGRLALWSRESGLELDSQSVAAGRWSPLALANPRLAPYGVGAQAVMEGLEVSPEIKQVTAENVSQALHFARSGAARVAFVSFSQVRDAGGSLWLPDPSRYPAIEQQGLVLDPRGQPFYDFLFSDKARERIRGAGYALPAPEDS